MRALLILLACLLPSLSTGCGMMSAGRDMADSTLDTMTPRDRDYRDDANLSGDYNDEWKQVGKEGRGNMPVEREWDGLTKHWMSPKAQAIESNLGYGY